MKAPNADQITVMRSMHERGSSFQTIARATGYDRRTCKRYIEEPSPAEVRGAVMRPTVAAESISSPDPDYQAAVVVETAQEQIAKRAQLARARLWDVIMDTSQPGQAVVGAFRELQESEGWAGAGAIELPEPKNDDEIVTRFVAIFDSYPAALQTRLRAALTRSSSVSQA